MKLEYRVNPYIPVTQQRHLVYVLIEVVPDITKAAASALLNLGLVVDASRSMSIPILSDQQFADLKSKGLAKQVTVDGVRVWQIEVPKNTKVDAPSNMDFTKQALTIVTDYLQPSDRFSLVAFAQDALLMVRNMPGTHRDQLLDAIGRLDQIDLGDETYMARGMEKGYEQLLPSLAPDRVSRLIVLTDGYTQEEHDCYEWTRAAKAKGIVVSTMGLGLDFNEELLISLADASGGNAYFIDEPSDIPGAFRQELAQVKSITWRDLSLSLALPTDTALRRAHRVAPTIAPLESQAGSIVLGDLQTNQPPSVLIELIVPPRPAGNYRLAQITLHGRPAGSQKADPIAVQDVLISYTERPSQAGQTDAHLMSAVQRVSAFKLQNQAIDEAARGNVAGATRRLRMAGERLIEMGQEDLGHTMIVEADLIEKEGQMSAEGTKKLRYGTRRLSRKRG